MEFSVGVESLRQGSESLAISADSLNSLSYKLKGSKAFRKESFLF